jgi:hypothetical protein
MVACLAGCTGWAGSIVGFRAERHGGLHEQGTVLQIALGDEGEPVPPMLLLSRNKSYRPHHFLQICGLFARNTGLTISFSH